MKLTKLIMGQIIILAILLGVSLSLYPDIVRVKRNHKTPQPQKPKQVKSLFPRIPKEKNLMDEIEKSREKKELANNKDNE